jgi:hypothetical protein
MRVVDRRNELSTVYIGRGSVYGNPFTHLPLANTQAIVQVGSVDEAVKAYRDWLDGDPKWAHIEPDRRLAILAKIPTLKDDDVLGCYCRPRHACHGDVLVEFWEAHLADLRAW